MADLICPGSIVAVESGDYTEDYYLLRCSDRPRELESEETIGGLVQPMGTLVVDGEWFDIVKSQPGRSYRLLNMKASVCLNSIRHICPENLTRVGGRSGQYLKVEESLHEDIIASLLG